MGTVYRALDRQTGEPVAIKVLHARLSENPNAHFRLATEFRAASALEHPNVVRALAVENDGETSFLVYELVAGRSVADWLDANGPMPEEAAVRIVTQVAQALHYAHERRVIHRDVKPDNILLLEDGKAKLTDFGLAKDAAIENPDLTQPATGLGTPHYMAPEQFSEAKSADARCDVYSLAATLYTMLTNRKPFDAKTPVVILTNKELFRLAPIREFAPAVSEPLETAVRAALNPDPAERPATCLDFFKRLTGRPDRGWSNSTSSLALPVDERRAAARVAVVVGSVAVLSPDAVGDSGSQEFWPLVVRDVSATGLGVLLARRFEPGTRFAVELGALPGRPEVRLPATVVRVESEQAGHWVHGCRFDAPLAPADLERLVSESSGAGERGG
jgi:serine/threonine protein kinase